MTAILDRARRRLGYRGAVLLILGVFDEIYALGIPSADSAGSATGRWLATIAPLDAWAAVWAAAGLAVIAGAFAARDEWAYATAIALKLLWSLLYLLGWGLHGVYRGWVGAAVWALIAAWVLIDASRPERQWPAA